MFDTTKIKQNQLAVKGLTYAYIILVDSQIIMLVILLGGSSRRFEDWLYRTAWFAELD